MRTSRHKRERLIQIQNYISELEAMPTQNKKNKSNVIAYWRLQLEIVSKYKDDNKGSINQIPI